MERVEEEHLRMHWDCSAWCEVQRNGREVHPSLRAAAQRGVPIWRVRKQERKGHSGEGYQPKRGMLAWKGCGLKRGMLIKEWGAHPGGGC